MTSPHLSSSGADIGFKGKHMAMESHASAGEFTTGLGILLLAQLMSAYMGAYVEDTYAMYGASWTENLFFTHIFSLPLFLPLSGSLRRQYARLAATPALKLREHFVLLGKDSAIAEYINHSSIEFLCDVTGSMPQGVLYLLVNAVTQLVCISGVNVLSAKSSAVTVTIVLNIRKLVSFMLSTLVFGHQLSGKMILGSALVFGSGALYGWETSWRMPKERRSNAARQAANGRLESKHK